MVLFLLLQLLTGSSEVSASERNGSGKEHTYKQVGKLPFFLVMSFNFSAAKWFSREIIHNWE